MTWLVMSTYGVTRCETPQDVVLAKAEHLIHTGLEFVQIVRIPSPAKPEAES